MNSTTTTRIIIVTPTPPGPIPAGCLTAAGRPVTILDVTLQAATDTVPAGATLCLTAATGSQTITVLGAGETTTATVNVVLATPPTYTTCPAGFVAAAISSSPAGGPPPIPPTATIVCVQ
jgi:hypothetical protein